MDLNMYDSSKQSHLTCFQNINFFLAKIGGETQISTPLTSDWKICPKLSPEASQKQQLLFPAEKHMHQEEHSRSPGQNSEASC